MLFGPQKPGIGNKQYEIMAPYRTILGFNALNVINRTPIAV